MEVVKHCVNDKRLYLLGVSLFAIMLVSGIYAVSSEITSSNKNISTSAVDLELKEYDQDGNPFNEDGKKVMPGDKINLVTKVNNLGIDCYIRTKLIYKVHKNTIVEKNYINGNYKSWEEKDGYYYYESVFKENETVELFDEIVIPKNLTNSSSGKKVTLTIIVDAVQSEHFNNNWDNIEIKKSVDRTYDIDFDGEMPIVYENNSQDHIKIDDDFFNDLKDIIPGDKKSEVISINNVSKSKKRYYLSIDYNNLTEEELKLLNKMELTIKKENGKTIAKNSLANIKNIVLGTYKSGEKDNLTISIYLPIDADNDYSKLLSKIVFRFYLENPSDELINPATSDESFDWSIKVFIMSSIGFLIVLLVEKKNDLDIEKNKIKEGK